MKYFRVEFLSAAADEGDGWTYKQFQQCDYCGLRYVNYFSEFLVPEDTVDIVQAEVWEPINDMILEVAGLIVGEISFVDKMKNAGITGFEIKDAQIMCDQDEEMTLPEYRWVFVTGRCHIIDVWDRIVSICPHCKTARTENVEATVRRLTLKSPLPTHDLCRSRDRRAGLIVSENFVNLIQTNWSDYRDHIRFKEISVE